jgi:5-(carboxyamino)imidazole ribonucleotide mutase
MENKKVLIVVGSQNDLPVMEGAAEILKKFEVGYEVHVSSAHRSIKRTVVLFEEAKDKGFKVIIAAAGMSAHLPGVAAACTILPVIGVPVDSSSLHGLDSLLSIVQMPGGIPVAATAIGKSGAVNAALLAVSILSLNSDELSEKLKNYRKELTDKVIAADSNIEM